MQYKEWSTAGQTISQELVPEEKIQHALRILQSLWLKPFSLSYLEGYIRHIVYDQAADNSDISFSYKLFVDSGEKQFRILGSIESALKEASPDIVVSYVPEAKLLKDPSLVEKASGRASLLAVTDCSDKPMSSSEKAAWEIVVSHFEANPSLARVLCASREVFQTRFRANEHLYYRVFRYDIVQGDVSVEDVENFIHNRLQARGLEPDSEFDEALHAYLEDIFATADLKGEAFLKDLEERIVTLHSSRLPDKILYKTDVPFHFPKHPASEINPPATPVQSEKDLEELRRQIYLPETVPPFDDQTGSAVEELWSEPLESNNKACIILFLSDYKTPGNKVLPEQKYKAPGIQGIRQGRVLAYTGTHTNDVPVQYLIDCAHAKHQYVSVILCITSGKVKNDDLLETGITSFSRFEKRVKNYLRASGQNEQNLPCQIIPIPYDYAESASGIVKVSDLQERGYHIFSEINRIVSDSRFATDHYYVDYTGGLRDTNFLLISIMRFLEYSGHPCGKIVYSSLPEKSIIDMSYLYDMFQLINGTGEFVTSGSSRQLQDVFPKSSSEINPAADLIDAMAAFSDTISLCDVERLDQASADVETCLENSVADTADYSIQSVPGDRLLKEHMLFSMKPLIEKKLFLGSGIWSYTGSRRRPERYLKLIRWCIENHLYQQALTFYVEKMPVVYRESHLFDQLIVYANPDEKLKNGESIEYNGLYTRLYEKIRLMPLDPLNEFDNFKNTISSLKDRLSARIEENRRSDHPAPLTDDVRELLASSGFSDEVGNRFSDFLQNYNNTTGRINPTHTQDPPVLELSSNGYSIRFSNPPKTIVWFLKAMINSCVSNFQYLSFVHYLLYSDPGRLNAYKEAADGRFSPFGTYLKKTYAVSCLASGIIPEEVLNNQSELQLLMAYYLSVKMLRNSINHAAERSGSDNTDNSERDSSEEDLNNAIHILEQTLFQDPEGNPIHLRLEDNGHYTREIIDAILRGGLDISEYILEHNVIFEYHPHRQHTDYLAHNPTPQSSSATPDAASNEAVPEAPAPASSYRVLILAETRLKQKQIDVLRQQSHDAGYNWDSKDHSPQFSPGEAYPIQYYSRDGGATSDEKKIFKNLVKKAISDLQGSPALILADEIDLQVLENDLKRWRQELSYDYDILRIRKQPGIGWGIVTQDVSV